MEKTFYNSYFELEKDNWWFRVRRNLILSIIKKFAKGHNLKTFDFGCGSGFFVGELQRQGYDSYGMDFEAVAIEHGSKSGIRNLVVGEGDKMDYEDETFDVITSLDVLEHLENEKLAIGELVRILKPGGKMIITVPAYMWLWGVQDDVAHHFRRYTKDSLNKAFERYSPLGIVKSSYFNTLLFPVIAIVRLFSKWFNVKGRESDFDINNKLTNALLYWIFNLETYFLKIINFPFGSSILLVLEKNDQAFKK